MKIELRRAEGPVHECDKPFKCESFFDANVKLKAHSWSAPEGGGYDKVDFTIIDEATGLHYEGRYDLKHWKVETPDLKAHVVGFLEFYAGRSCPSHMTQERYEAFLADYDESFRNNAAATADFFKAQS